MNPSAGIPVRLTVLTLLLLAAACGGGGGGGPILPPPIPPPPVEVITITTNSTVTCVQTVAFSLTMQATGAASAVAWRVTSGVLPPGLSLDSASGVLSGTATGGSGNQVTIQASDAKATTSQLFNFVVWARLMVRVVPPQAAAHLNAPYSLSLYAQSSTPIASWTMTAGQLPPGLSFSTGQFDLSFDLVTGTPSQAGSYTFTVQAQDFSLPQTASAAVTIVVDNHLVITKTSIKSGRQNQTYSDSFTAVNGTLPYQWTISGNFPPGLALDAASGQVTGTATDFGNFNYSVSITDSGSTVQSDSGQGTVDIAEQLTIQGSLPSAYIGTAYAQSLNVVGGLYPYTWSVESGALPSGLTLGSQGLISGTATQLGTSNFTLQVSDAGSPPYVVADAVTFQVVPQLLNISYHLLSPAPVNVKYHSQVPISGGTPPYSWSISSGQLPPGLALDPSTGYLDGTPAQVGTFNFFVVGMDAGNPPQTANTNDFIQIRPAIGRNDSIAMATPLGNSANVQNPTPYSISPYIDPIDATIPNPDTDFYRLIAGGGSVVHVETFARRTGGANTLDSVIEILDSSGRRRQNCTAPGYFSNCLNDNIDSSTLDSALDFRVPGPASTQTIFYAHVFDWRGDARPDMQYYLNISGVVEPLTISPATLGGGSSRGVAYLQQLSARGGSGAVTWMLDGGALPAGWSFSASGLLAGTAMIDGSYVFAVKATDSGNPAQVARTQYNFQIAEPLVVISPAVFPNACAGRPYTFAIQTTGGIPPLHFSFSSNTWAAINLDQITGIFSGTPAGVGTYTGTLGVLDSAQPFSNQGQQVNLTVVTCP